jgi:hypothetical protein
MGKGNGMAAVGVDRSWETAEERERMIGAARRARRKDLRPTRPPDADTLLKDMRGQRTITDSDLRRLITADFDQPVVSLYINLSPDDAVVPGKAARLELLNSMRHSELAARRYLVDQLAPVQKELLERDLDELETLLEIPDLSGHRSVVAFKSGHQLHRAAALHVRTPDELRIDIDPYVAPLETLLETHPPAVVVEVEKEKAQLWSLRLGELEEVDAVESFVPAETVDKSRPGKVQRHRLMHLVWHLKETAQLATRLLDEQPRAVLVLVGDDTLLAGLEEHLPKRAAGRLARRLPLHPGRDRAELERHLEQVLRDHRGAEEAAALEALGEYRAAGVLVAGMGAVLDVANRFFMRRLFIAGGLRQPGFVCKEHHYLASAAGRCPFDDAELFPAADLVDELVEYSRLHGVELTMVEMLPERLEPHGGIAAVTYRQAD